MPAVSISLKGGVTEDTNRLRRYPPDSLPQNAHVQGPGRADKTSVQKWTLALKAMAAQSIQYRRLFLLYQSVILRVLDYGLVLTTLSNSTCPSWTGRKMKP